MSEATEPWLNSFVPNLVWLPDPLSVMSDRDGPVRDMLQQASLKRYRQEVSPAPELTDRLFHHLQLTRGV